MKTSLIRIGDSLGIRIPRAILEQCHLRDEVECEVRRGTLVVLAARRPRQGWASAFREMHRKGEDRLLDDGRWPETR